MNQDLWLESWLTIQAILKHAEHYDWSLQGFGMFRLYLSREVRLHVWDSKFAYANVTRIHNHPWDFSSRVVRGEMTDVTYEIVDPNTWPENLKPNTHREQRIVCGPGGGSIGESREVILRKYSPRVFHTGSVYSLQAKVIHESMPVDGTITLVHRTFHDDTEHAMVYPQIYQPWISAEPRPATRAEILDMAKRTLA